MRAGVLTSSLGWHTGQIAEYDGAELAVAAQAVVVTIQYRLGPLGFFQSSEIAREDLQVRQQCNFSFDM